MGLANVVTLLCLLCTTSIFIPLVAVEAQPGPLVIGHRGASADFPENTLLAFLRALEVESVAGIETDLRLSKDQVVVLLHDSTLDRTTNGTGDLANYTVAELEQFSAGYPKRFGDRFEDLRIPTFKQALELLIEFPAALLVMDLKVEGLGQAIASTINEVETERNITDLQGRVIASCWTETQVADIGQFLNITVKQKLGSAPLDVTNNYFSDVLGLGIHSFSLDYTTLSPEWIGAAHRRMMPVVAWTVDGQSQVVQLIDMGVDGIITNRPHNVSSYISAYFAGSSSSDKFSLSDMIWLSLSSVGV